VLHRFLAVARGPKWGRAKGWAVVDDDVAVTWSGSGGNGGQRDELGGCREVQTAVRRFVGDPGASKAVPSSSRCVPMNVSAHSRRCPFAVQQTVVGHLLRPG
jgi:hypothetical protein